MAGFCKRLLCACVFFGILSCGNTFLVSEIDHPHTGHVRQALVEQLSTLDYARICRHDSSYIDELKASFDADNRYYYIERRYSDGTGSFLFIIDLSRPNDVLITVYAPYELEYQWLICRLRVIRGQVFGRLLFMPDMVFAETGDLQLSGGRKDSQLLLAAGQ